MTGVKGPYVSRGGLKLAAALDRFGVRVAGLVCADLGCSHGGFVDCLLQADARRVYAVDTGYGVLAWKLRTDPSVVVMERTNALHVAPPWLEMTGATARSPDGRRRPPVMGQVDVPQTPVPLDDTHGCQLVTVDLGWTPQHRAIPAAMGWLEHTDRSRIITLIKPQYEAGLQALGHSGQRPGVLDDSTGLAVTRRVLDRMPAYGVRVLGWMRSPIRGGGGRGQGGGNYEYLAVLGITNP